MSNTVIKIHIQNHELIYKINKENGIWVSTRYYNFDMDSIPSDVKER